MDAQEHADENGAATPATDEGHAASPGNASAFRRALDAQAVPEGTGRALMRTGPHDLTIPIERVRIPGPSSRWTRTGAATPQTGDSVESASSVPHALTGSSTAPALRSRQQEGPRRIRIALSASGALAVLAVLAFVLISEEGTPASRASALPGEPFMSGSILITATDGTGSKAAARLSARPSGSATARPTRSASASPSASPSVTAAAMPSGEASASSPSSAAASTLSAGTVASSSAAGPALANAQTGGCLGTAGSSYSSGNAEQVAPCSGSAFQAWTVTSAGELTQDGGSYCLDDYSWGTTPGSAVDLWPCNGGGNQQWTIASNGTIVSAASGLCLSLSGSSVDLDTCGGQAGEKWSWQ